MSKRRATSVPGAGAGVVGAYETDADHRLGPDAQTDLSGTISRIVMGFTGPSGIVDLELRLSTDYHGRASDSLFIARKYWELQGGPRIVYLEGRRDEMTDERRAALLKKGYFVDPHTNNILKRKESFPCTASNCTMLSAYLISTISGCMGDNFNDSTSYGSMSLRLFKLPTLCTEIRKVNLSGDHDGTEPWQQMFTDNLDEIKTSVDMQRAVMKASDGRAYFERKMAMFNEYAAIWCKAELTLGSDSEPR